jgi:hypothetical protein
MPLTPFQKEVARLLAAHRNPDSHVAGGAVINRADASPRYSADLDFFHDVADSVRSSAVADAATLVGHGFVVEWLLQQPLLHRARVSRGNEQLKLEWCFDSSFRFFPVLQDPDFGYCLHSADLATNKVLALAGRSEIRDLIDILYLHAHYLSLGAICWAACGKDQGYTPWSLLDQVKRNTRFREEDLASGYLAQPATLTLPDLKRQWQEAASSAEQLFPRLPAHEAGCLYLDQTGAPVTPDPDSAEFAGLVRHFGSVRGGWPKLS